jgi:hypothetical protein
MVGSTFTVRIVDRTGAARGGVAHTCMHRRASFTALPQRSFAAEAQCQTPFLFQRRRKGDAGARSIHCKYGRGLFAGSVQHDLPARSSTAGNRLVTVLFSTAMPSLVPIGGVRLALACVLAQIAKHE